MTAPTVPAETPAPAPAPAAPASRPISRWNPRNPWRHPWFLEGFTWLYLVWSLVPIVIAVLF